MLNYRTSLKINVPIAFDANFIRNSLLEKDKCNNAIQQMFALVDDVERKYLLKKPLFIWQDNIAITTSKLTALMDSSVIEISRPIYQSLINEVFTSEDFNGKTFSPKRFDLITSILYNVKSSIEANGEKWEDHPAREYLNNLRKNVGGDNVSFQTKWVNGVLPAIAAFILKGDEPDKLEDFLIENEIADYRLAFGFYGALFGFVGLSKVFTNNLFNIRDLAYLSNIYKTIFKQLHNVELIGDFVKQEEVSKLNETNTTITVPSRINSKFQNKEDVNHEEEEGIFEELKKFDPKVYSCKKEYVEFISKYGLSDDLIRAIKESKLKAKTNAVSFFRGKIEKNTTIKETSKKNIPVSLELFPSDSKALFYSDVNAWGHIKTFVPTKHHMQVKKDLLWFQGHFNIEFHDEIKGVVKGIYSDSFKENSDVIKTFDKYLNNKKTSGNPKMKWLSDIYSQIDIDAIIHRLRIIYP